MLLFLLYANDKIIMFLVNFWINESITTKQLYNADRPVATQPHPTPSPLHSPPPLQTHHLPLKISGSIFFSKIKLTLLSTVMRPFVWSSHIHKTPLLMGACSLIISSQCNNICNCIIIFS